MADKIQNAYESSKHIYDDVLTQGSILSKLYIKFFWSGTDDNEIARELLSYIPDDYSGNILDVPVGTAVFTAKKWAALTSAKITCLDYSKDMIEQAENRLGQYKQSFLRSIPSSAGWRTLRRSSATRSAAARTLPQPSPTGMRWWPSRGAASAS